jgi:FtsP/CotA-like multicopper oxidase with cupredoxin domain
MTMNLRTTVIAKRFHYAALALFALAAAGLAATGYTAVPGIAGPDFALTAAAGRVSQPDGNSVYAWGYGCTSEPSTANFVPFAGSCPAGRMQMPGPTLVVTEGETVHVTLTNKLPPAAGNTSMVFSGFTVTASGGAHGLLTQEATSASPVTYTFTATKPGTYTYYSGTRPDLQIEMGLFGVVIVKPTSIPAGCRSITPGDFRIAPAAYDLASTCYDREYLFQFSEMSLRVHQLAEEQAAACPAAPCPEISVPTEPYLPNYYLVNGRSMPDDMDSHYAPGYPTQPYNGNPHMHPGDLVLMRVVGQGRWQHPFHFHGNHARVLARDGNPLVSRTDATKLAGPLLFTIPTVSGQSVDAIFTWTGQGLNWDVYGVTNGHKCNSLDVPSVGFDPITHEYCPDHGKPIPVTPPDPNIVANGLWYGGTPYLGLQAANGTPLPPGQTRQNPKAGYAYMWHSHNEREITTNDVFPGGMMMMLIIDPPDIIIDETL